MTVEEVEFVHSTPDGEAPAATDPPVPLRCSRCGSGRVVPRATIWDHNTYSYSGGMPLQVYVSGKPEALVFRGTVCATLYARVCADCGHAELYADGAERLYEAYQRSQTAETT
jgi:hypothetical protein